MNTAERLNKAHLRATPNRIRLLEFLEMKARPMSHTEILSELRDFDRVTLYRILDAFTAKKIIHRVQGTDGIWRFCTHSNDKIGCPGGHPHLLCEICGKMTCLSDTPLPYVKIDNGFKVHHKQYLIIGTCAECAQKQASKNSGKSVQTDVPQKIRDH